MGLSGVVAAKLPKRGARRKLSDFGRG